MEFRNYHPFINLIFFVCAIVFTLWFNEPVLVAISCICAFAYAAHAAGDRALKFNLCLLPLTLAGTAAYMWFNHFGVTVLGHNSTGNSITLESGVYGFLICIVVYSVIMWMECVFAVITSDKLVYLFGRISPGLSLFVSILLRLWPETKKEWNRIRTARKGMAVKMNPVTELIGRFSMVVTWGIDRIMSSTESMKSRGYTLRGRTAYSLYRFDNRDRGVIVLIALCLGIIFTGAGLGLNWILYDPEIIFNTFTPLSAGLYMAYIVFLTMPIWLEYALYKAGRS